MFFYISIIVSIIGLLIATYTDIKERIVSNKLNFSLAIIGLIIYGAWSLFEKNLTPLFFSIFGLCFGFFFGWVLWKMGVFAGGDVKLFMALGALNPFTPALINYNLLTNINMPIFPITLFLYSLVSFFPYGFFIILLKLKEKKKERKIIFKKLKENSIQGVHAALLISFIYLIFLTYLPFVHVIFQLITIILAGILLQKLKTMKNVLELLFLIIAILINPLLFIQLFLGLTIMILFFYGTLKLFMSSRILLVTTVEIKDLEEGMIPQKSLIKKGKKVVEVDGISLSKIIKYTLQKRATQILNEDNQIISANKARGLIVEEIEQLKQLEKKGLINNTLKIKESMPFVPTMLISYILCLLFGDALILFLVGL